MHKVVSVILVTISLSGCMYQTVNQYDIQRSITICGSLEKIVEISAHHSGGETVLCSTGSERNLTRADQVNK